eukprot:scaffold2221_cov368-Prasinococcus_capsulatus_cf.AAC.4
MQVLSAFSAQTILSQPYVGLKCIIRDTCVCMHCSSCLPRSDSVSSHIAWRLTGMVPLSLSTSQACRGTGGA